MRELSTLLTVLLILASCGSDSGGDQPDATTLTAPPDTTVSTPSVPDTPAAEENICAKKPAAPGEYERLSMAGAVERPYWLVVPATYVDRTPAPLYLHLASGNGDHDAFLAGWRPYLDDLPGLMALVNTEQPATPNELLAIADEVSHDYCIDMRRIHVMGTSWSEGMAIRLACDASDRIASFVAALGSSAPLSGCAPDRAVPLLSFTGDVDRPSVTDLVDRWAEFNGCDPDVAVEDLGSGVARKTYQDCRGDVVFYDIEGMGHFWPLHEAKGPGAELVAEYDEVDYLDESLRFFSEHPLP